METPPSSGTAPSAASAGKPKSAVVKNECVQVVVRCRPMSKRELAGGDFKSVVDVYPLRGVIEIENPAEQTRDNAKMFTYDAVYDKNSTQQDIYDEIVRPLVTSVLEGFNCCVFAYGQTGTGKTHTMEGVRSDGAQQGIIPRAFEQIWSHISRAENQTFLVTASYMEIYMEELRDLLRPAARPLELREREHCGVFVPNLHAVDCKNVDEMLAVMAQGNRNRTTGKTNMNEHSSRSHAIFTIKIEMCDQSTNKVNVGKLNLIDLAGSERQSKTGATAERLREASKINRALSSLGNVISALAENSPHIPYRDSKLTRLLQDSLGGNSKTIMIANIGPSGYNYNETLTTLRYAHRAKTIQNKPVKNVDPQDAKLKEYQEEIARLRLLITERQNREKTLPRRPKHEKIKKIKAKPTVVRHTKPAASAATNGLKAVVANGDEDEDDDEEDYDDDDDDEEEEEQNADSNVLAHAELDADTQEAVQREKEISQQLANKLRELESQVVQGGRNILETYSERQLELEKRLNEIAERKKREVEMQQQLEATEESTIRPMRDTLSTVQEEVELKTRKLKKCYTKYMALKQELVDTRDDHNRDRRELEMTQNELIKELKRLLLIIDNFVPVEVKVRLYTQSRYDEEQEEWSIHPTHLTESTRSAGSGQAAAAHTRRPVSVPTRRRPISEYALKQIKASDANPAARVPAIYSTATTTAASPTSAAGDAGFEQVVRFKGENIVAYELDLPMRTTNEYQNPKVSASLRAVLAEAMQTTDELDISGGDKSSYPANMRSRLDKIMKRDSSTGGNGPMGAAASNGGHSNGGSIMMGSSRSKSSIPEVTRRSSSATPKKPTSAYPKARGLVTNK